MKGVFKKVVKGTEKIVNKIDHEAGKLLNGDQDEHLRAKVEKDALNKSPEKVSNEQLL